MMDYIISKIDDSHLYLITMKNMAKEMWEAVLQTFQRTSHENAKFGASYLICSSTPKCLSLAILKEFTWKCERLWNLGDQMKKEDFMLQCLNSLSKEYLPVKIIIQDRDLNSMLLEKFVLFIISYGKKMLSENYQVNTNLPQGVLSFHVQGQMNQHTQYHNCKKPGHKSQNHKVGRFMMIHRIIF